MVFKYKSLLFLFLCIFFLITSYLQANIIYDKDNVIITEIDLNYYKKLHSQQFNEIISNSKAIKNLVIIKKLVINLKKNNPKFLEKIDENISNELDVENIKSEIILDILRYFKTRNEFIYTYIKNDFKKDDLKNIFNSFDNLNLPLSNNNCLTIIKFVDLKYNSDFISIFYKNLKNQSEDLKISIDDLDYNVCINEKNREIIDKQIFKYANIIIEDKFNEFIYAK